LKLISHYKERKFLSSHEKEGAKSKSLPAMVSKIIDGTVKVMLAPAFGLKPRGRDRNSSGDTGSKRQRSSSRGRTDKTSSGNRGEKDPTCWACGKVGHRYTTVRQNELDSALAPRKMGANKKQRNQFANSIKILENASLVPSASLPMIKTTDQILRA
jgi:hypothetical protein